MYYDVTLPFTRDMMADAGKEQEIVLKGHMGTHFDVMDKEFPLSYCVLPAVLFDVASVPADREINAEDIDTSLLRKRCFAGFCSGFSERVPYGSRAYHKEHPQFSYDLIDLLLDCGVSLIAVDFAGLRRGKEHTPADQRCADRGAFVIENLYGMRSVPKDAAALTAYTFPIRLIGSSGLPCRVVLGSD